MKQAKRVTIVDGYRMKHGSVHPAMDVIIDFADARRLSANQVGDGETNALNDIMELLMLETGLPPEHASTADDVPRFVQTDGFGGNT